jgi:protein-S-isoprenylcysteine O-methyltransferase Ste14
VPALAWPWLIFALILVLHGFLPGRWVEGYVKDGAGNRLRYHLNGLPVFFVSIVLWVLACRSGLLAWDAFYLARWEMAASACVAGLAFTAVIVLPVARQPGASLLADLYLGRLDNPRWRQGRVDAKMALYLLGATLLELNLLSYAAHHVLRFPDDPSPGVFLYVGLFTFFLVEYLFFEEVHLYTYDFMAEKVGFKLGWGCLVFYPFFYAVGLWTRADEPNPHTPSLLLALVALMFFTGWALARGANLQKFSFKRDASRSFLGVAPEALGEGDRKVLVNGWWGVARHVNYLGELLMASALALSLGAPLAVGPWLYPLYYVALLVPRQRADDARCAVRYGPLWEEYERRVPWRIIPFVY